MRLLSLDLDRFGPFTGRRLVFRPDARLHVVLGPNEAGKSCAARGRDRPPVRHQGNPLRIPPSG